MRDATYVYQNELDKVYLQRDMAESIMCKSSDIAKNCSNDLQMFLIKSLLLLFKMKLCQTDN